jgi:hypothetical protein
MPTFCRHNRLLHNCPICAREEDVEMRPVVSSSAPKIAQPRPPRSGSATSSQSRSSTRSSAGRGGARGGLTIRRLERGVEDGYRSELVPGLKSGADAERLTEELAFADARLHRLRTDPPGLYAEVADPTGDVEERTWLAFLIAYLGPLEDEAPFADIEAARVRWSSDQRLALDEVRTGPRGVHDLRRGTRTIDAYRGWAARAGSQQAAFTGEAAWTPERRFSRVYERLALPGFTRDARFELLSSLGATGVYDLQAASLALGGSDGVTAAAKRVLGIGDPLLLERRAAELAAAAGLPLEAADVGLYNWERGHRARLGMPADVEPDPAVVEAVRGVLGL